MAKQKKPRDYGYNPDRDKARHEGDRPMEEMEFWRRVVYMRRSVPDIVSGGLSPSYAWNNILAPLARDLLPSSELAQLVRRYGHGQSYEDLDRETKRQLNQATLTRITRHLERQGEGGGGGGGGGGGNGKAKSNAGRNAKGQPSQQQKGQASSQPADGASAGGSQGGQAPQPGDAGHPQPGAGQAGGQAKPEGQEGQKEEQVDGQPQGGPSGQQAQPQQPEKTQDGDSEDAKQPGHEKGGKPEGSSGGDASQQKADALAQKLAQAAARAKEGTGEQQVAHAIGPAPQEAPEEESEWQDIINEMTTQDATNTAGSSASVDELLSAVGYGGGGKTLDLDLPMRKPEERLFHTVQEAFMRLAGEPDVSDKVPDGTEAWWAKKLAVARWKPQTVPTAKHDWVRSPEDIYFILDTSGSVSQWANIIAAMAAGALGLVHLYHGPEAHPTFQILRNTPLKTPSAFKGLGREYGTVREGKDGGKTAEKQKDVCNTAVVGYDKFWGAHRLSHCWDTDLEWWLKQVKPAYGSRLIFWGDTMSVNFKDPQYIKRLLRPYRFVWMLPFGLDEWKRHYMGRGLAVGDVPDFDKLLQNPTAYSSCEYLKLLAVGLQVIGNASSPGGMRDALRRVK